VRLVVDADALNNPETTQSTLKKLGLQDSILSSIVEASSAAALGDDKHVVAIIEADDKAPYIDAVKEAHDNPPLFTPRELIQLGRRLNDVDKTRSSKSYRG
jgi:hypothetical protein